MLRDMIAAQAAWAEILHLAEGADGLDGVTAYMTPCGAVGLRIDGLDEALGRAESPKDGPSDARPYGPEEVERWNAVKGADGWSVWDDLVLLEPRSGPLQDLLERPLVECLRRFGVLVPDRSPEARGRMLALLQSHADMERS